MRCVLQEHGGAEADARFHRRGDLACNQRLAAQDAVLIGEGEAHDRELAGLDAALDLAGRRLALVGPQAGLLGEMHALQASSHATRGGSVSAAQLDPERRRASNSFQ